MRYNCGFIQVKEKRPNTDAKHTCLKFKNISALRTNRKLDIFRLTKLQQLLLLNLIKKPTRLARLHDLSPPRLVASLPNSCSGSGSFLLWYLYLSAAISLCFNKFVRESSVIGDSPQRTCLKREELMANQILQS